VSPGEWRIAYSTHIAVRRRLGLSGSRRHRSPTSVPGSGAPSSRHPALTIAIATIAAFAFLALGAAGASAEYIHGPVNAEFGPGGTGATSWGSSNTLAYQQAEQKIYVLADSAIYGFSNPSAGTFSPLGGNFPIGVSSSSTDSDIAVDNSATASAGHIIYNADGPNIVGYSSTGTSLGFTINTGAENCGVAVDNEGHIWGGNYGHENMGEWPAEGGAAINTVALGPSIGRPCKIAVDQSNNDVWPSRYGSAELAKYTAASGYTSFTKFTGLDSSNNRITVNGMRHVVYIGGVNSKKIRSYSTTTDELLETFEAPGNVRGLAVKESDDTVFVSTNTGKVFELKGIAIAKATTGEPTGNTTVSGTADPDGAGEIEECYFEYGLEGAGGSSPYGSKQACNVPSGINAATPVEATLSGLLGEETYHYRLALKNANGVAHGADKTIVPHNVKGLKTEAATGVTRTTAKLNGSFEGTNETTTYYFQYGLTSEYGYRSPTAPNETNAGKTTGPTPMSANISGLQPETTYHFRVVGKNPIGVSPGKDMTFTTPEAVEGVTTEGTSGVTRTTAVLHGSFNGNGESHSFYFEYGPTTAYGHVAGGPAGNAKGTIDVEEEIRGLAVQLPSSKPYHYRLVAVNSTGMTVGADETFVTLPPAVPVVSNEGATEVGRTQAVLNATINPGEGATAYVFQFGSDATYGSSTEASESIGNDTSFHRVESTVTGLTPGTIYHYRVVAFNYGGTAAGPDQTFTTPDLPRIEASTASSVSRTSAHLSALVSGNASPTDAHFEYGLSGSYGTATTPAFAGSSLLASEVGTDVVGLAPGTTYHYRAVAVNGLGTTVGTDQTFTTLPPEGVTPKPKRCKRGFVRRHGKCVKKKHRKKKHKHHRRHG
jgi:hypothetical protein